MRAPQQDEIGIVCVSFVVYWIVDLTARQIWPHLLDKKFFKDPKTALILGRHTMDVVACFLFIYLGWKAHMDPELQQWDDASVTPMERTYQKNPTVQVLVLTQIAYQVKNLIDSYVCGDGAVFYAHHIGTAILCLFGAYPFLHAWGPFFLGYVEISTALLCVLGTFDDDHGVIGLGDMYPKTKVVFGIIFAAAFVPIRIVIWPYLSYFFWLDMLAVLEVGPHSWSVIVYSLATNAGLTLLQFYWLVEIVVTARKNDIGGMLTTAFGIGSSSEEAKASTPAEKPISSKLAPTSKPEQARLSKPAAATTLEQTRKPSTQARARANTPEQRQTKAD